MTTIPAPLPDGGIRRVSHIVLAALLIIAAVLAARDLTSEAAVSLHGDMSRYMMDGVFVWDFITSGGAWSADAAIQYAQEYFARYPALSLGHHPPLIFVVQVPFFAIFGVSVFAARLSMIACVLFATAFLFSFARRRYGWHAASWVTLLFVTNPVMVGFSQRVLSEVPMITCVLGALVALDRFCDTQRSRYYLWFMVAVVASLYAKQLAIFMAPVYAVVLVTRLGWRRLLQTDVVLPTVIGGLLVLPLIAMTYVLSPFNIGVAINATGRNVTARGELVLSTIKSHLSWPALAAVVAGVGVAVAQRDRRILLHLLWLAGVVGGAVVFTGRSDPRRYALLAIPAYCLCAASLAGNVRWPLVRRLGIGLLVLVVGAQIWIGRNVRPIGAGGYEEMARFMVAESRSPVVLYSATIDTGYFVFFVRKHDPDSRLVILRSDKILTTSMMSRLAVEDRVTSPEEVYATLDRFGVQYVVIEDRRNNSTVLEMFRSELKTDRFIERHRIRIATSDRRLAGVDLVAYEYRTPQPPDPDAEVDMKLPIIGRGINVRLGDLIGK